MPAAGGGLEHLVVGVPNQGGLSGRALERISRFLDVPRPQPGRSLAFPVGQVEVLLAREEDIPALVSERALDVGIAGMDHLYESGFGKSFEPLATFKCRMCLLAPQDAVQPFRIEGATIASQYPTTAGHYVDEHGGGATIRRIAGAAELYPYLGLADAIIDIVNTGETARQNGLAVVDTLFSSGPIVAYVAKDVRAKTFARRLAEFWRDDSEPKPD